MRQYSSMGLAGLANTNIEGCYVDGFVPFQRRIQTQIRGGAEGGQGLYQGGQQGEQRLYQGRGRGGRDYIRGGRPYLRGGWCPPLAPPWIRHCPIPGTHQVDKTRPQGVIPGLLHKSHSILKVYYKEKRGYVTN